MQDRCATKMARDRDNVCTNTFGWAFQSNATIALMMEAIEFARKRSKLIGNKNDGERIDGPFLFRFLGRAAHFSRSQ